MFTFFNKRLNKSFVQNHGNPHQTVQNTPFFLHTPKQLSAKISEQTEISDKIFKGLFWKVGPPCPGVALKVGFIKHKGRG